jgi:hypothetical protein
VEDTWLIVYRGYSDVDLASEVTWLRTQIRNPFSAQTEGGRSYARSTAEMRDRLSAATQVTAERTQTTFVRHGTADFSGV